MRYIEELSHWSFDLIDLFIFKRTIFIPIQTIFQGGLINEHFINWQ